MRIGLAEAEKRGAQQKAIIFTESRRTQSYLLRVLADSPFAEGIVLFNGSNNDERSKQIYAAWLERHRGTDRVSGSRTADMRSAIVDYFREEGRIMIATEAGAEGINLQFCSLVVNSKQIKLSGPHAAISAVRCLMRRMKLINCVSSSLRRSRESWINRFQVRLNLQ